MAAAILGHVRIVELLTAQKAETRAPADDATMDNASAITFEVNQSLLDLRVVKMHGTVITDVKTVPKIASCVIA